MLSFWDKRYEVHGHTGWSDRTLYEYDQKARLNAVEKIINDLNFTRFLDIGCGSGDFTKLCLNKKNHSSGVGIDISEKVVNALKDEFKPSSKVKFCRVDLTEDPLPPQEFDLIICVTVLQHLGDDQKIIGAIRNIKASMKLDGHLLILENVYGDAKASNDGYIRTNISSQKWKDLLTAGGMEVIDVGTYTHWGVVLLESIQSA
jgi:SAM-dependent methyltransferase